MNFTEVFGKANWIGTGNDAEEISVVSGYSTPDTDATVYSTWHTTPHLPAEPAAQPAG